MVIVVAACLVPSSHPEPCRDTSTVVAFLHVTACTKYDALIISLQASIIDLYGSGETWPWLLATGRKLLVPSKRGWFYVSYVTFTLVCAV
jgi:hypothetical protein